MRNPSIFLFWALLASSPLFAQPVPTLQVATNQEYYLTDASNKIYIESRVGTTASLPAAAPVAHHNLAFILDRSGSMAGAPIQALREAMATTLNSLSAQDVVSVVLFGSEVETLVEAKPRDQLGTLDTLLAQIEPAGGAALYDALNQGRARHANAGRRRSRLGSRDGRRLPSPIGVLRAWVC